MKAIRRIAIVAAALLLAAITLPLLFDANQFL